MLGRAERPPGGFGRGTGDPGGGRGLPGRCGYDESNGARPLRRAIQSRVEDPAAELLLEGKIQAGDTLRLTVEGERLELRKAQV